MGIEPTALAWEARVLPLYDARLGGHCSQDYRRWQIARDDDFALDAQSQKLIIHLGYFAR